MPAFMFAIRTFCLSLFMIMLLGISYAQAPVSALMVQADAEQEAFRDNSAIHLYEQVLQQEPDNRKALYKLVILYLRIGWLVEDDNKPLAEERYRKAMKHARHLYSIAPNSFEGNLCMGGATARLAQFYSAKDRVHAAWDIKKYADVALSINPEYPDLKHLLAWWNYELTKPTWLERSLAKMLFGGIPNGADVQHSIDYMKELISHRPDYTVYKYDLAVFYNYIGEQMEAKKLLKQVLDLRPKAPEDHSYIESAKRFLQRLQ